MSVCDLGPNEVYDTNIRDQYPFLVKIVSIVEDTSIRTYSRKTKAAKYIHLRGTSPSRNGNFKIKVFTFIVHCCDHEGAGCFYFNSVLAVWCYVSLPLGVVRGLACCL